ncbi:hypothetical protein [Rhodococcus opacus]
MRRVRERVEPYVGAPGTGRQRLVAMSIAHVENLMTDLGYHHVVHQGVRDQASTALRVRQRDALAALNELRRDYERMFHHVITERIADGSLRNVNDALATRTLLSNLNAVDVWYRKIEGQTEEDVHDLASQVVDLLIVRNRRDTGRSGPTPLARDPRARSTTRKAYRPRGIEGQCARCDPQDRTRLGPGRPDRLCDDPRRGRSHLRRAISLEDSTEVIEVAGTFGRYVLDIPTE